jgi:hypothetical protein
VCAWQVTGVSPNHYHTASVNSRQFHIALQQSRHGSDSSLAEHSGNSSSQRSQQQQQQQQQQRLMEQSRVMMEASKVVWKSSFLPHLVSVLTVCTCAASSVIKNQARDVDKFFKTLAKLANSYEFLLAKSGNNWLNV